MSHAISPRATHDDAQPVAQADAVAGWPKPTVLQMACGDLARRMRHLAAFGALLSWVVVLLR